MARVVSHRWERVRAMVMVSLCCQSRVIVAFRHHQGKGEDEDESDGERSLSLLSRG